MSTSPETRDKRCRLSLECSLAAKEALENHGTELGQWSLIGAIRKSVARSKRLFDLEKRGSLVLIRDSDGEAEDVVIEEPKKS